MLIPLTKIGDSIRINTNALQPGQYLCKIIPIKADKPISEYRAQIFAEIDEFCKFSGQDRYTIYNQFKEKSNITSLKDLTIDKFPEFVENLKFFLFNLYTD